MSYQFTAPAAGGGWRPKDAVGHLLVIAPTEHVTGIKTAYSTDSDAVRATVHDIDAATSDPDTLIFTGSLVAALKPRLGQMVLARLGLGIAKPGQNPPYLLQDASGDPAAAAAAAAYLDGIGGPGPGEAQQAVDPLAGLTPAQLAAIAALQQQQQQQQAPF